MGQGLDQAFRLRIHAKQRGEPWLPQVCIDKESRNGHLGEGQRKIGGEIGDPDPPVGSDDGKGVLTLRQGPGCERRPHRTEGFRGRAEGLVADDQLTGKAAFVDAEIQNRIIVAFRYRQKQTVAPHQPQRDRRFPKGQPFAPLKSADSLDLSLAQIAGREDLLFNRVLRCLDGDNVLRLFLVIWFDRHWLKLSIFDCRPPPTPAVRQTTLPAIVSRTVQVFLGRRGGPKQLSPKPLAQNHSTIEYGRVLSTHAGRRRLRRDAPMLGLTRRALSIAPKNGPEAEWSRSIGKRTRRSAASARSARISPSARPAAIPTGITINGFGNAGLTGGDALSRTVMSENVSLLFSLACSAALWRALSSSARKLTSRCNSVSRSRCA